jgi:S-DNA-T family DNA segregation ATPase FtsK/SpoIIIE
LIAANPSQTAAVLDVLAAPSVTSIEGEARQRSTLLVVDSTLPTRLRGSEGERLRSALRGEAWPVAGLTIASTRDELLASCTTVVETRGAEIRVEDADAVRGFVEGYPWGISRRLARVTARSLARFEDVDLPEAGGGLPDNVSVISLLGFDSFEPGQVVRRWEGFDEVHHAKDADPGLRTRVGMDADGPFEIDITRHGPHSLIAGMSGSGKSELLSSLIIGLAVAVPPEHLVFGLFDFKGGASFRVFEPLPHTVGSLSDLDGALAARALRCLQAELQHRKELFAAQGVIDIRQYRARVRSAGDYTPENVPYLVVVIDEFASMAQKVPDLFEAIDVIAREGRSLGVHLVLATQKPGGVISEDVRANSNLWISLRVQDPADSREVIGVPDAATIARPGRAYVKIGPSSPELIQSALATAISGGEHLRPVEVRPFAVLPSSRRAAGSRVPEEESPQFPAQPSDVERNDLERLVEMVAAAHRTCGRPMPRRPFPDPLGPVDLEDLLREDAVRENLARSGSQIVFARADDPDAQDQYPVAWDLDHGNLLLYGVVGSGVTTALTTVALSAGKGPGPLTPAVYALDFAGSGLSPLADLPYVGAVVGAGSRERQVRLVRMLLRELARRRAAGGASEQFRRLIVLVDGLGAFRAEHGGIGGEIIDAFDRVFAEGPECGIHMCVACERVGAIPIALSSLVPQRLVLRLAEAIDYAQVSVPAAGAALITQPGRAWLSESAQLVQVATTTTRPLEDRIRSLAERWGSTERPTPIEELPEHVPLSAVAGLGRHEGADWYLPVGIGDRDLAPAFLNLLEAEHAFVGGPARCGKSTVLATLAEVARRTLGEAYVVACASRPSVLTDGAFLDQTCRSESEMVALCQLLSDRQGPVLLLVDDAERIGDVVGAALQALLAARQPDLHVVAAGRPEFLRGIYNHWTQTVRKSRVGVLLRPDVDMDGELLGVPLPRHTQTRFVPGRGYLVNSGELELVQMAMPDSMLSGR